MNAILIESREERTMKRAMVLTAALLSAAMLLPGQSDGNDQWRTLLTWGVANGRYWNQLLPVQKVHYVQGFMDGVAMAQSIDSAVNAPKSIPYGLTNGEIIKSLDRFFDTPENGPRQVTAHCAIAVVTFGDLADSSTSLTFHQWGLKFAIGSGW